MSDVPVVSCQAVLHPHSLPMQGMYPVVWLPRAAFLGALQNGLMNHMEAGCMKLRYNMQVTDIRMENTSHSTQLQHAGAQKPSDTIIEGLPAGKSVGKAVDGQGPYPLLVTAVDGLSGERVVYAPRLVIGADGMHSCVRGALQAWAASSGERCDNPCMTVELKRCCHRWLSFRCSTTVSVHRPRLLCTMHTVLLFAGVVQGVTAKPCKCAHM